MNIYDALILKALGGGGGTTVVANPEGEATDDLEKLQVGSDIYEIPKDYAELDNKPSINSVELSGNKTASELGLQAELDGAQTVSGNPITVADAESMNAESVVVELEPKQDLHGYDAPWAGGAGKNKLDEDYSTSYTNAVKLQAGTYYCQGFVEGAPSHTNTRLEFSDDNSTWEMVGIPSTDARITTSGWDGGWVESGIVTMTFTTTTELYFRVWLVEGTLDNRHLSISSEQLTEFEPYSNICPISGYSEVNVERVGKNLLNSNYYSGSHASQNNVDIVKNDDGSLNVTINGSCESTVNYLFKNTDTSSGLKSGNYKATVKAEGSYTGNINLVLGGASSTLPYSDIAMNNVASLTVPSDDDTIGYCLLQIPTGATVTGTLKLYPMIANEDANMTIFEPYQGNTYTIDLDGTRYGGTLDVTEGVLTLTHGSVTESDFTYQGGTSAGGLSWANYDTNNIVSNDSICSELQIQMSTEAWGSTTPCYTISDNVGIRVYGNFTSQQDFEDKYANLQVVYKLATPLTIRLTPTDIPLLENTNNISTDGTNITLKYQPNNVIGECKAYTDEQIEKVLPPLPTTDGTYHLSCEVTSGVGVLSWVSDS